MSLTVWRISNHSDLSGLGGKFSEGRWNHLGDEIVYCSDHPATCLLEQLVRFNPKHTPRNYKLLEIQIPQDCQIHEPELKADWQDDKDYTRDLWNLFCGIEIAPIMKVPSALIPQAMTYLLNPSHTDHHKISITKTHQNFIDERFYNSP